MLVLAVPWRPIEREGIHHRSLLQRLDCVAFALLIRDGEATATTRRDVGAALEDAIAFAGGSHDRCGDQGTLSRRYGA
jgi:hypothetical protein